MSASPDLNRPPPPESSPVSTPPVLSLRPPDEEQGRIAAASTSPPKADTEFAGAECRTPTSEDSKLPSVPPSCPPAPRKPRRVVLCKRKLCSELEFIVVGAKEMEQLFRLKDQQFEARKQNHHGKKRKLR